MTEFIFTNNAFSGVATAFGPSAATITIASGTGAAFPAPASGQWFAITLTDQATRLVHEVVYVLNRTGDNFQTVLRGQEGTAAGTWAIGDIVQHNVTAGTLAAFAQGSGFLNLQIFSSSATYTPTPGAGRVVAAVQAAGGGSAGVAGPGNSSLLAAGEAGSSGQYAAGQFFGPFSSILVTVGSGGAGGAAGQNDGSAGAGSSFGSLLQTFGGPGGKAFAPTAPPFVNGGGQLASGTIIGGNIEAGELGNAGGLIIAMTTTNWASAQGGASHFAGPASGGTPATSPNPGRLGGGGGGIVAPGNNTLGTPGVRGGDGIVYVWEFSA
jgi:hypothetical protein